MTSLLISSRAQSSARVTIDGRWKRRPSGATRPVRHDPAGLVAFTQRCRDRGGSCGALGSQQNFNDTRQEGDLDHSGARRRRPGGFRPTHNSPHLAARPRVFCSDQPQWGCAGECLGFK
jgi:hypothetical protein